MPALETIHGTVTFSNNAVVALTMDGTDSLTVKNFGTGKNAYLLNTWAWLIAAGYVRIRSPRLHDNVQGIRVRVPTASVFPLLPLDNKQTIYAQDALIAELLAADAAGNIEEMSLTNYYEDLPGIVARLITSSELDKRIKNIVTVETTLAAPITGLYSPAVALNTNFDLLKANTDYAVLGCHTDVRCLMVTLKGPDTGNLRVGVPGETSMREIMADWFQILSDREGVPLIPVINSANKAATFAEAVGNSAAALTVNANWVMAELTPS